MRERFARAYLALVGLLLQHPDKIKGLLDLRQFVHQARLALRELHLEELVLLHALLEALQDCVHILSGLRQWGARAPSASAVGIAPRWGA